MNEGKCGARHYGNIDQTKIDAIIAQLKEHGATVTGHNPWDVDTHNYGVKLRGSWDKAASTLTIIVTDKSRVPCSRIWDDPLIHHIQAISVEEIEEVTGFQKICNEWGNWFSKKHGTTCKWVKLHAEGSGMEQYQQYKINVRYESTVFGTQSPLDAPGFVYTQDFVNDTDIEQSNTFTRDESTTASFTWSLTEGIKVGLKASGEVGLPLVAKGKVEASVEVDFSSTQSWTDSETQRWSVSQPVKVPPHKKVTAVLAIEQKKYDIDFTSNLVIGGWVAIWNNDKIDLGNGKHWLYFFPVSRVLIDKPHPGYVVRGNEVVFKAKGKFTGMQGVGSRVKLTQYPLDAALLRSLSATADLLPVEAGTEKANLINPVIGYIPDDVGSQPKD